MPECDRCGDDHATVNEIEWVNQSRRLCPTCWEDCKAWITSSRQAIEKRRRYRENNPEKFDA